jgi:hypothetical protein
MWSNALLTNDEKKCILGSYLDTIRGLSDKVYQKRIWICGEGPECDDFTETCCHFSDFEGIVLNEYKEFGITDSQYVLLKKFVDVFDGFSDLNNHPEEFIDTPEWNRITEMAKEVLKAFNTL